MLRKIITIDPELCNGCGRCIDACHEGALQLVDGKARLVADSYCDGLGACLPECPTGAIKIVEREAAPFTAPPGADQRDGAHHAAPAPPAPLACGCPGMLAKTIARATASREAADAGAGLAESSLANWPVQIRLAPVNAPYFRNAALLIAADCTAFAHPDIHRRFMAGKVTLIGCPKLDEVDYAEKLTAILQANEIKSVTVLRMEVPCCAGLANAARQALSASGKTMLFQVITIATDGRVLDN